MKRLVLLLLGVLFIGGCAGEPKMLPMRDTGLDPAGQGKGMKTVEFPKGTWTGTASTEQAGVLAQTFVNSHNMAMREFDQVKDNQEKIKGALQNLKESAQRLEEANQKILVSAQKNQDTAEKSLMRIEKLSKEQGTGEITLFYPTGSGKIAEGSLEYTVDWSSLWITSPGRAAAERCCLSISAALRRPAPRGSIGSWPRPVRNFLCR